MGLRGWAKRWKGLASFLAERDVKKAYAERMGDLKATEADGLRLVSYEKDGAVDYELYREIQNSANAMKLNSQWVGEDRIKVLAAIVRRHRDSVTFGICHGTRAGREQAWFASALDADVIGTEIADSATQFPNTVQWDFHDVNPDWTGRADFVYSNSWDHAFAPEKAFRAWADSLAAGGVMLLDCADGHAPSSVSAMDPFGASASALAKALDNWLSDLGKVVETADGGEHRGKPVQTVVFQRF